MIDHHDTPLLRAVRESVDRCGQGVVAVVNGEGTPSQAHTIGNANRGLPELLGLGAFMPQRIFTILAQIGHEMRKARKPPGMYIDLGRTYPIKTRIAGPAAMTFYTDSAGKYLGHADYAVVQLLFADPLGRYPGEENCDPRYEVQHV